MLMGPAGFFEMKEGVIRALRHAHLGEEDAAFTEQKRGQNEAQDSWSLRRDAG